MKLSKPILATAFLIQTFAASAHSPILHDDEASYTINSPFEIDDPEHSKAVYSELKGLVNTCQKLLQLQQKQY